MTIHVAKRVKGLVYGRYAVLSQVWNHPFNRGSRLKSDPGTIFCGMPSATRWTHATS